MSFIEKRVYEFSKSGENKLIQKEFSKQTIQGTIVKCTTKSKTHPQIKFSIIKKTDFDSYPVQIEYQDSEWDVWPTKIQSPETGKFWEPNPSYKEMVYGCIYGIYQGSMSTISASTIFLQLFDFLEIQTLSTDESIFYEEFPNFYKYRKDVIKKNDLKVVKETMSS